MTKTKEVIVITVTQEEKEKLLKKHSELISLYKKHCSVLSDIVDVEQNPALKTFFILEISDRQKAIEEMSDRVDNELDRYHTPMYGSKISYNEMMDLLVEMVEVCSDALEYYTVYLNKIRSTNG